MLPEESGKLYWSDLPQIAHAGFEKSTEWVVPNVGDRISCHPSFSHGSGRVLDLIPDYGTASGLMVVTDNYPSGFCCSWVARIIK